MCTLATSGAEVYIIDPTRASEGMSEPAVLDDDEDEEADAAALMTSSEGMRPPRFVAMRAPRATEVSREEGGHLTSDIVRRAEDVENGSSSVAGRVDRRSSGLASSLKLYIYNDEMIKGMGINRGGRGEGRQ